ncbi:hypothetical protein [Rothia nasimurium]|uniref:hypothetical protein n=1 Tax=Rothia nasimurium TaxID=85336 RepID=UPI003B9EE08E
MVKHTETGEEAPRRSRSHAPIGQAKEGLTTSIQKVAKFSEQVGDFGELVGDFTEKVGDITGRAAGILTSRDARIVRVRLSLTALLVTLLALVVAAVGNYYSLPHTPEETVDRYLAAQVRGDYTSSINRPAYSFGSTYLTNAIYSAAEGRIDSYTITGTRIDGPGIAQVSVEAVVDGHSHAFTLPLTLEPRTGPFNDLWVISTPTHAALTLTSPVALASVRINDQPLTLPVTRRTADANGYNWSVPTPPGTYTFSLPSNSYYTLGSTGPSITIPFPGDEATSLDHQALTLDVRPSPRMWNEANDLVTAWLERCERSRRLESPGCPSSQLHGEDTTETIRNVRWELTSRPAFVLEQDSQKPDTWHASRYRPATFTVTYTADGQAQRETIDFFINAEIVSDGTFADIRVGLGGQEETEAQVRQAEETEAANQSTLEQVADTDTTR